ncbi:hypothetical protein EV648_112177 [Kribbella sp. VKM Ac-2568]|nr:hypothetical protein EV648_112177 [Kribbella sp. VKM Ac-2568]
MTCPRPPLGVPSPYKPHCHRLTAPSGRPIAGCSATGALQTASQRTTRHPPSRTSRAQSRGVTHSCCGLPLERPGGHNPQHEQVTPAVSPGRSRSPAFEGATPQTQGCPPRIRGGNPHPEGSTPTTRAGTPGGRPESEGATHTLRGQPLRGHADIAANREPEGWGPGWKGDWDPGGGEGTGTPAGERDWGARRWKGELGPRRHGEGELRPRRHGEGDGTRRGGVENREPCGRRENRELAGCRAPSWGYHLYPAQTSPRDPRSCVPSLVGMGWVKSRNLFRSRRDAEGALDARHPD